MRTLELQEEELRHLSHAELTTSEVLALLATGKFEIEPARACPQLSQMIAAARWIAARKFLAVLS
jgi:hypothetical protein